MAEAEETSSVECVFCLSKDKRLVDPRELPCTHVSCRQCLIGQLEAQKVVWCKDCNKIFDVKIDDLPAYKPALPKHQCEVCLKKGKNVPAVMYCTTCSKKHCKSHQESHDDLHDQHATLTISQYLEQAERLETRYCAEHKTEAYTLGCENCLSVFCTNCISPNSYCAGEKAHKLLNLKDLVANLASKIDKLIELVIAKENELSDLFKEGSKVCAEFEKETQTMLEQLRKRRDEQILAIQLKYQKIEESLLDSRRKTQEKVTDFMECEVGSILTRLGSQRADIEARIRSNHHVDVIQKYKDMQQKVEKLSQESFPELLIDGVQKLFVTVESRDVEVDMVQSPNIALRCKSIAPSQFPPKSCSFIKSIETRTFCHAVCHYQSKTYLGTQDFKIIVIEQGKEQKTIVALQERHWAYGIAIHKYKIYALVSSFKNPCTINVYDLTGQLLSQFNRDDECHYTRLSIVSDQLVVADHESKQLTVYSLTGKVIKHISCPNLCRRHLSLCTVGSESVIATSKQNSLVQRVNINTGRTEWECSEVKSPHAVAPYGKDLLCIAGNQELSFLHVNTGNMISQLEAPDVIFASHNPDIDIHDNTLIASSKIGGSSKLVYYNLNL